MLGKLVFLDQRALHGLPSVTPMPDVRNNSAMHVSRCMVVGLLLVPIAFAWAQTATAGMPRTQKHEVRHEIDQLEDTWRNAILKGNTAAMDSLLADDYMAISASGTLQSKEETLANLRSGRVHFTTLDISDRKVRFYGTTALVTSVASVAGSTPDGEIAGNFRYTRVYVRNPQGVWKVVSFEASRMREPGEHK
jgi:ketosteroid isomerase-like protein